MNSGFKCGIKELEKYKFNRRVLRVKNRLGFTNVKKVRSNRIYMIVTLLFSCFLVACNEHYIVGTTSSNTELSNYRVAFVDPVALAIKSDHALYIAKDKHGGLTVFQSLDDNHGLIFFYNEDVDYKFTMEGMKFNIDMIFLDLVLNENGDEHYKIDHIVRDAKAGKTGFGSPRSFNAVLEIPAHDSYTYGLAPGDVMIFTSQSLLAADYLNEGKGHSFILNGLSARGTTVTVESEKIVSKSFQAAVKTLSSKEFKKRLLLRLSRQGWGRLATEPEIAIKDLSEHEGKNIQVNLFVDDLVPGDARTGCGKASEEGINISIHPRVLGKGEPYLSGTIAHELTHHIGNGYGDKPCYVDSGFMTRALGKLMWFKGGDKIENRNRLPYNVGGLVCEMVAFRQGINEPKCPQG
jgi:uncharacterized membrane protein (UPF0127 family)